jgi:hypothetical protein
MKNITLLITGIINKNSVDYIDKYKLYDIDIVYSTYFPKNENEQDLIIQLKSKLPEDKISINNFPEINNVINKRNIYYQSYSAVNGLKLINTEFTVKTRSDWQFNDLTYLIKIINDNKDKVIVCNYGTAKCNITPYHPSDFLIGMSTKLMISVFNNLLTDYLIMSKYRFPEYFVPEIYICISTLAEYGFNVDMKNYNDIETCKLWMKKIYIIINLYDLESIIWTSIDFGIKSPIRYDYFANTIDEL